MARKVRGTNGTKNPRMVRKIHGTKRPRYEKSTNGTNSLWYEKSGNPMKEDERTVWLLTAPGPEMPDYFASTTN